MKWQQLLQLNVFDDISKIKEQAEKIAKKSAIIKGNVRIRFRLVGIYLY